MSHDRTARGARRRGGRVAVPGLVSAIIRSGPVRADRPVLSAILSGVTAKDDELVLGLPRDAVPGGLDWRGVQPLPHAPLSAALEQHGSYRRRGDAEDDPAWKQVIPYLALRDGGHIFLMRRTRA